MALLDLGGNPPRLPVNRPLSRNRAADADDRMPLVRVAARGRATQRPIVLAGLPLLTNLLILSASDGRFYIRRKAATSVFDRFETDIYLRARSRDSVGIGG
jgi:hypothetical protein